MDRGPLQFLDNGLPSMVYGQKIKTSRPQIMGREGVLAVPPKFIALKNRRADALCADIHRLPSNAGNASQTTDVQFATC